MNPYKEQTGIEPFLGVDSRFEHEVGDYEATFTSRGCPKRCPFCIVPKIEPRLLEYERWQASNVILDSNILATSWDHQCHVVEKLKALKRIDFNSGFDPCFFSEDHFALYKGLDLRCWRFSFDSLKEEKCVRDALRLLRSEGISYREIMVYVLYNFKEEPEDAHYRAQRIIEWGGSPFVMRYRPLDWLSERMYPHTYLGVRIYTSEKWEEREVINFGRYYNCPWVWRSVSWDEYSHTYRRRKRRLPAYAGTGTSLLGVGCGDLF